MLCRFYEKDPNKPGSYRFMEEKEIDPQRNYTLIERDPFPMTSVAVGNPMTTYVTTGTTRTFTGRSQPHRPQVDYFEV